MTVPVVLNAPMILMLKISTLIKNEIPDVNTEVNEIRTMFRTTANLQKILNHILHKTTIFKHSHEVSHITHMNKKLCATQNRLRAPP